MLHLTLAAGIGAGIGLGVGHWARCRTGRCPLRAIWWRWALYGAIVGGMLTWFAENGGNAF